MTMLFKKQRETAKRSISASVVLAVAAIVISLVTLFAVVIRRG